MISYTYNATYENDLPVELCNRELVALVDHLVVGVISIVSKAYPFMDVEHGPDRGRLHPRRSRLPDLFENFKGFPNVAVEVLLAEHNSEARCVFDCHACSLALMWHHLNLC